MAMGRTELFKLTTWKRYMKLKLKIDNETILYMFTMSYLPLSEKRVNMKVPRTVAICGREEKRIIVETTTTHQGDLLQALPHQEAGLRLEINEVYFTVEENGDVPSIPNCTLFTGSNMNKRT